MLPLVFSLQIIVQGPNLQKTGLLSVLAPRWEIEQKRPGVIFRLYITKLELKKKDFHSVSLWNLFSTWMLLRKSDHQSSSKTGIHPVISKYSSIFSMLRLSDTFRWKLLLKLWYLSHSEGFNVIFMKKK